MLVEDLKLQIREYRESAKSLQGYYESDKGKALEYKQKGYYKVLEIDGLEEVLNLVEDIDIKNSVV